MKVITKSDEKGKVVYSSEILYNLVLCAMKEVDGVVDFDVNDFFNKLFDFLKVYIPFLVAILFLGANRISKIVKKSIIVRLYVISQLSSGEMI